MPDFHLEIINNQSKLIRLADNLSVVSFFSLDIETVDWWNRHQERIALIQLAFRENNRVKVAVIDSLAKLDLDVLAMPLESSKPTKVIHNAAFDAIRLYNHHKFKVAPIYDTMLAARRSGEKKYSLQAQSLAHLNLHLDKSVRSSDWSRRPLDLRQVNYAALDAYATLRLYENQLKRNLNGSYFLKEAPLSKQIQLPLDDASQPIISPPLTSPLTEKSPLSSVREEIFPELSAPLIALLGVISDLPARYGPEQLAVSVGTERVGVAGWIIDRMLGRNADFDEDSARLVIAELFEKNLIRFTDTRRLVATERGAQLWQKAKPK